MDACLRVIVSSALVSFLTVSAMAQPAASPPAPASKPATSPAAPEAGARTRKQVEDLLVEAEKAQPDWWKSVQPMHPQSLELTWTTPAPTERNPNKFLSQYLQAALRSDANVWKSTIKTLHLVLTANKDDAEKTRKTDDSLGQFYELLADPARAVVWYRKGNQDPASLARCYWGLNCKELALEACDRVKGDLSGKTVGLLAAMGELEKAAALADATAKAGPPEVAYLHAGDACRWAGQYAAAEALYRKGQQSGGTSRPKFVQLAEEAAEAAKIMAALDISKVKDGTYTGTGTRGYRGPITVQVVVKGGRILSVRVTEQKEDAKYFAIANGVVPTKIVERQGFKGVDTITGATISGDTIVAAVAKALASGMK